MALSTAQKRILDKFEVLPTLQHWIAQEFDPNGGPLSAGAPDFLKVMADYLQTAEIYLESQRIKLIRLQNPKEELKTSTEEWKVMIETQENVVKDAWLNSTTYWRIIDQIILNPKEYSVQLDRNHIEHAFEKRILPLVEILKWVMPEYFVITPRSLGVKLMAGLFGSIGGAFLGIWGGLQGGKRLAKKNKQGFNFLRVAIYSFLGMFTGFAMGASQGGMFGFQTGDSKLGTTFGYRAAYLNPFNNPAGSKNQQAVDLDRLALLFKQSSLDKSKGLEEGYRETFF